MPDEQQTATCGPDTETPVTGFQEIAFDMETPPDTAPEEAVVVGGDTLPVDDTPEIKAEIVHKLLGSAMALPNYVLLAKNQEPLQSLAMEQYDKNFDGLGKKASAQLSKMVDLNPTFAKWLMQAVDFERKYGDLGMFGATVLRSVVMEMGMRRQQAEESEKKEEKPSTEEQPEQAEEAPEQAGETLKGTIDEPDE